MWRTFVVPVFHKQAGLLRNSSGFGSNRFFSIYVTEHECRDGNPSVTDVKTNQTFIKAQNTVVRLFLKPKHDVCNEMHSSKVDFHNPFIQSLLDQLNIRYTDLAQGSKISDLTICTPKTRRNENGSGFGFKNVFMDFEKLCYGVVVVSSLISWHRLLFKDVTKNSCQDSSVWNIYDFGSKSPHVLPVNGPVKPIDPFDAACSSLESAMDDCTAVTENALAIRFSTFKLHEKALTLFQSASRKGNVAAHFNLGLCYEKGLGTTQDISKAVSSYKVAASHGHQNASFNLGIIFLQGKNYPDKKDEGLKMMEKAAKEGLVKAQRFLGLYYADDSNEDYNMKKSFQWLKMASEQSDIKAQYHLGICYERGLGVARNMQRAKEMYGCAAKNGHAGAQNNYALFHEHGLGGLCVDKQEALRWYSTAAENGNVNAKENLKFLQKEIDSGKRSPNLLERLFSDIWVTKPPTTSAGTVPRCSSSPDRLCMQSDMDSSKSSHESNVGEKQRIEYKDSKCIWVI